MDKILFSLPVHEKPDIVREQVDNINYFCPGSTIVIHVAEDAAEGLEAFLRLSDVENAFVNPVSYPVTESRGLLHTHVGNYQHALEKGIDFDKIVLLSCNELLIKHGLAKHVSDYSIGAQTEVFDLATDWGVFSPDLLNSGAMKNLLGELGLPLFFGGQAEGQFFGRNIFAHLARLYTAHFPMGPCGFPTEEVIPATIAARYCITGTNIAMPVTLSNGSNNLIFSEDVVAQVLQGTGTLYARRIPKALRSQHIGASVLKSVFSLSRIPREDCDLRRRIRGLMI